MTPMTGMSYKGVNVRARDARSALNRLRWEVEWAIEQGKARDAAGNDLAECAGIMLNILTVLGEGMRAEEPGPLEGVFGDAEAKFAGLIEWFTKYHNVPR